MTGGQQMQRNHAKSIKGMSIACIALSAVVICIFVACLAFLAVLDGMIVDAYYDPYFDESFLFDYYDEIFGMYGIGGSIFGMDGGSGLAQSMSPYDYYGYYDYSDDYAAYQIVAAFANIMLVCGIIAEVLVLVAGIVVLRNHCKPDKLNLVFGWSIAVAVLGFLGSGFIQGVLFVIIAVFANSDKKLYRAGLYYAEVMPAGAPAPMSVGAPVGVPTGGAPVAMPAVAPNAAPAAPNAGEAAAAPVGAPVGPVATPADEAATPAMLTQPPAPSSSIAVAEEAVEDVPAESQEDDAIVVVDDGAIIQIDVDESESEK